MPRPTTPRSLLSSTAKENRPAWYSGSSPGRPRTGKGKPLGELKAVNRAPEADVLPKSERAQVVKKTSVLHEFKSLTSKPKVNPPEAATLVPHPQPIGTSRPKTPRAPVTDETPPRTRQPKKSAGLATPTGKIKKPLSAAGTPKCTPPTRARDKSRSREETPRRLVRERPDPAPGCKTSDLKDKAQSSSSTYSASRAKKTSLTPGKAPVKHLFLSPQVAKKNSKKEPLRKSFENHGISVGPVTRKRAGEKREADSEMPPAQPTNSPELPKRGSREASTEGIRGYFGAGPMVAPEGMALVRDRRKCKPRGTLVVGVEGDNFDSESSGTVESSIQMPLPSVASVEWMMNNEVMGSLNDFQSGASRGASSSSLSDIKGGHRGSLTSFQSSLSKGASSSPLSDIKNRGNNVRESSRRDRSSQEIIGEGFLQQLKQSRHSGDFYYQHARRSQAFLQHLRQSQRSRDGSSTHHRRSQSIGEGSLRQSVQAEHSDLHDFEYEDITIDWRQGLPSGSVDYARNSQDPGELASSSISFTSSWVPHLEDNRRLSGNARSWYTPESSWYGFSPLTPEFHRASPLLEGGLKAIDPLLTASVRRRIMTDQSASADNLDMSSTSLTHIMQNVVLDESFSNLSTHSSQDISSSFQFTTRTYADAPAIDMEPIPADTFICQTASPIEEPMFSEEFLCQTASPIEEIYSIDYSDEANSDDRSDQVLESDDEVQYASPIMSDFFSPEKRSSPSAGFEKGGTSLESCDEPNVCARAARRSSMSRTLEELMRHNFTL